METTIQVITEEVDKTAAEIEELAADYQAKYNQLYSVTEAMTSQLRGDEIVTFVNQFDSFKDDFTKMHRLMLDYADFLKKAADAYRKVQEDNIEMIHQLRHH